MTTTIVAATIVYAALNFIIGFWKFRADSFESFVSYRNRLGLPLLVLTLNGSFIGGGMFFAVGQMAFEAGTAPLMLAVATTVGLTGLAVLAPRIRRMSDEHNARTIYDLIQARLPEAKLYLSLYVVTNVLLYFFLLASQFLVLATFLETFGDLKATPALTAAVAIVAVNALVYGMVGGFKKDVWGDVFQLAAIGAGAAVIIWSLAGRDWVPALRNGPAPAQTAAYGMLFWVGGILFLTPAFLVRYDMWQRVLAARNSRTAVLGCVLAIPVVVAAYVLFTLVGNLARVGPTPPTDSRFATLTALRDLLHGPWFAAAAIALYAAVVATADTFLNTTSVSVSRILGEAHLTEAQKLLRARGLTLIVCLAAVCLVLLADDVVDLLAGAFSSLVITTPSVLYIVFARRPRALVATASLVSGVVTFVGLYSTLPTFRKTAFVVATVVALMALGSTAIVSSRQAGER